MACRGLEDEKSSDRSRGFDGMTGGSNGEVM